MCGQWRIWNDGFLESLETRLRIGNSLFVLENLARLVSQRAPEGFIWIRLLGSRALS